MRISWIQSKWASFTLISVLLLSAGTVRAAAATVPPALVNAGEYGENIYDYAKANSWTKATAKLHSLETVAKQLDAGSDELKTSLTTLEKAVTAKDRQAAMQQANQITLEIANRTASYQQKVPVEVVKLDFYGRELEIWAQAKDTKKLQDTVDEMNKTWEAVRPQVESRNAAVAKTFGGQMALLKTLKSPSEYPPVAKRLLDEVDNLEKAFELPSPKK